MEPAAGPNIALSAWANAASGAVRSRFTSSCERCSYLTRLPMCARLRNIAGTQLSADKRHVFRCGVLLGAKAVTMQQHRRPLASPRNVSIPKDQPMNKPLRQFVGSLFMWAALVGPEPVRADVKLPGIFSDHMVLQRDMAVPVWGWAEPGEQVTVSIAGQSKTTQPDANGRWMVKLDPLKPAEPVTLTVRGKNTLTVQDVLSGSLAWLGPVEHGHER